MKKAVPYIILGIIVAGVAVLFFGSQKRKHHYFDDRITLRKRDKIPYGGYVAYQNLKNIFPETVISVSRAEPGYWEAVSNYESQQAVMIITPQFLPDDNEMKKIIAFAKAGNHVFISARHISMAALNILKCKSSMSFDAIDRDDSLKLTLTSPPFAKQFTTYCPGQRFDTYLYNFDSTITYILGKDEEGDPNFIRLQAGDGSIYLHLAPLAFSNYFLLHKKNITYYESVLSVLPANIKKLVWDEYYLTKYYGGSNSKSSKPKGWLGVLFQYPSLKWGLLTALFAGILFVLLEMRRKQRIIPVINRPHNDSLDFVKTIGRLYFEKGDHKNLATKMAAYFLEHIRNRYQLPTTRLDEAFANALHLKSGYAKKDIEEITGFINFIDMAPAVSENQLARFHKQLELFYKSA